MMSFTQKMNVPKITKTPYLYICVLSPKVTVLDVQAANQGIVKLYISSLFLPSIHHY